MMNLQERPLSIATCSATFLQLFSILFWTSFIQRFCWVHVISPIPDDFGVQGRHGLRCPILWGNVTLLLLASTSIPDASLSQQIQRCRFAWQKQSNVIQTFDITVVEPVDAGVLAPVSWEQKMQSGMSLLEECTESSAKNTLAKFASCLAVAEQSLHSFSFLNKLLHCTLQLPKKSAAPVLNRCGQQNSQTFNFEAAKASSANTCTTSF